MAEGKVYGGLTPEGRLQDRRRRLLDAALELFSAQGATTARIDEVCAAAGVTARHFYEAFGSRERLLLDLYEEVVTANLTATVEALAAAGADLEERVRAGLAAALGHWTEDPRRARIAFVEVVGATAAVEEHRMATLERYAQALVLEHGHEVAAGLVPPGDAEWASRALVGATVQVVVSWLHLGQEVAVDRLVDELVRVHLAVLRSN